MATRPILLAALLLLTVGAVCVTPFIGTQAIKPGMIISDSTHPLEFDIFWRLRVPRTCMAFLAGMALSASGMAFQAMFRNPLATPFTLGVAGGASLGSALCIRLGLAFTLLGIGGHVICAFVGALLTILLVYSLTRVRQGFSCATLLLAGVAISFFSSSLILFIQYLCGFVDSYRIMRWLMGELAVTGYASIKNLLPFVVIGCGILLCLTRELNLLVSGEEIAASRGVDLRRTKKMLFLATSLMVGGVVALCGPIGFVGMMVPHICRICFGADHRLLTPAVLLFGGSFLTLCDTLARTLIAPAEMPVGVITALLGGPFFLWLLMSGGLSQGGFFNTNE
jgi:iron complex transport system permease protein